MKIVTIIKYGYYNIKKNFCQVNFKTILDYFFNLTY
nr:MAG TPA: hypothetical protein [Bacteriophage sp.]